MKHARHAATSLAAAMVLVLGGVGGLHGEPAPERGSPASPGRKAPAMESIRIRLAGETVTATLESGEAARAFRALLPLTLNLTDYNATTADPAGMTGTDDFMEVRVSTDCGQTFARIPGFAQFNASNQPRNGSLTNYSINLSAYAGQQIILGFFASEGTVARFEPVKPVNVTSCGCAAVPTTVRVAVRLSLPGLPSPVVVVVTANE